jgi:hypothetical protein
VLDARIETELGQGSFGLDVDKAEDAIQVTDSDERGGEEDDGGERRGRNTEIRRRGRTEMISKEISGFGGDGVERGSDESSRS